MSSLNRLNQSVSLRVRGLTGFLFLRLDLKNGAPFVIPTFWANPVRGVRNAVLGAQRTVGVDRGLHRSHDIMRAALTRTAVGMTALWIRHFIL